MLGIRPFLLSGILFVPGVTMASGQVVSVRAEPLRPLVSVGISEWNGKVSAERTLPLESGTIRVPPGIAMPWRLRAPGFEPLEYTEADARANRPAVLRALGTVKGRIDGAGLREGDELRWILLRTGSEAPVEASFRLEANGAFSVELPAGLYDGVVVGAKVASRIRPGLVVRPGELTSTGSIPCSPTVPLSFRIIDDRSLAGIPGVTVAWDPPRKGILNAALASKLFSRRYSAVSDREGWVRFPSVGPLPTAVRWRLEAEGYSVAQTSESLVEDGREVIPNVRLHREASVSVRVVVPDGETLPRGTLALAEPDPANALRFVPKARMPLRSGETVFPKVSRGPWRLTVRRENGQLLAFRDFFVDTDSASVEFDLQTVEIFGTVTRSGEGVADVRVYFADPHDAKGILGEATTDPAGRYSMRTYHSGDAVLYVLSYRGSGHRSGSQQVTLTIDRGVPSYERDFELGGAGFSLLVSDAVSGRPLSEARADLRLEFRDGTGSMSLLRADTEGRLALSDFPPGTAKVSVQAKGYRAKELVVPLEGEGGELPVRLLPTRGISGRVVTQHGLPIVGASVLSGFPSEYSNQALFEAETDGEGRFRFETIPEQAGTFFVVAPGYALGIANLTPANDDAIVLARPDVGTVLLREEAGPPVAGHEVRAAPRGGVAIPSGALARLAEANGMGLSHLTRTSRDGVLVMPQFLPPGAYDLYLRVGGSLTGIGAVEIPIGGTRVVGVPSSAVSVRSH